MGYLTTHVLDTARGCPAVGLGIRLERLDDGRAESLSTMVTNDDGRLDSPLLSGAAHRAGTYQLIFSVGDYHAAIGDPNARRFLDVVVVRFRIHEADAHYHVPLLLSPYGYTTYRGS
ncbi:hydroxyisourate hydrolase [Salinisphaera sp. Q1T1-3]|uniref:hydroxyisourate hydrolase n=1 Tax=Salinisphaera sp. Q1T1-3 TaxID=2321229 RepID=UPI000E70E6EB|nr:hydroxyisourate hydrolase [Salinisphaera sp. Q1T1-3]RJS93807.1 hydroxyisourate hydrolase [Salinisphaera sp. Q1T1-3]